MTSGDDAIPHVDPAALPPLPAMPAAERAPGVAASRPPSSGPGVPADAQVGAPAAHEQIEHPIAAPHDVEVDAAVHDAAAHGSRIARAIEAAHAQAQARSAGAVEPDSRAQVLGGAAASAASGQAYAPRESNRVDERDHDEHLDPLARIGGIDEDPHRRDPRSGEEQRRDDAPLTE